jgi:hypothetical protein
MPRGASAVSYPAGTPPALSLALKEHLGDMALPGEPFDATDVVATGRHRRLIFIWRYETRWVVATEHGGIGYNNPVFAYELGADDQTAMLIEERVTAERHADSAPACHFGPPSTKSRNALLGPELIFNLSGTTVTSQHRGAQMRVIVLTICLSLAACASGAQPSQMVVTNGTVLATHSPLRNSLSVGPVTGGSKTSPLWKSNVSNEDFAESLRQTFAARTMLASGTARFVLNGELQLGVHGREAAAARRRGGNAREHQTVHRRTDRSVGKRSGVQAGSEGDFGTAFADTSGISGTN